VPKQVHTVRPHLHALANIAGYFFRYPLSTESINLDQLFPSCYSYQIENSENPSLVGFVLWYLSKLDNELVWNDDVWPDKCNSPIRQLFCGANLNSKSIFFVLNLNLQPNPDESKRLDPAVHAFLFPLSVTPPFLLLSVSRSDDSSRISYGTFLNVTKVSDDGTESQEPYELSGLIDKDNVAYIKHLGQWLRMKETILPISEGEVLNLRSEVIMLLYVDANRTPIRTNTNPYYWAGGSATTST